MTKLERMKEIAKANPDFGKRVGYKMCVIDKLHDIKELEKENAELKAQLQKKINTTTVSDYPYSALKLEEAKELIKNIVRVTWGEGWNYSLDWKVKAEQFLSEVEK